MPYGTRFEIFLVFLVAYVCGLAIATATYAFAYGPYFFFVFVGGLTASSPFALLSTLLIVIFPTFIAKHYLLSSCAISTFILSLFVPLFFSGNFPPIAEALSGDAIYVYFPLISVISSFLIFNYIFWRTSLR